MSSQDQSVITTNLEKIIQNNQLNTNCTEKPCNYGQTEETIHHNVTGRECGRGTKGLAGIPWVAAEVPEGYDRARGLPLRSVGCKPQVGLPSLQHQNWKGTQMTSSYEK